MLENITKDPDFDACIKACNDILAVKGFDYTQGSPNRLQNFDRNAERLGMRPEQVLAVYMNKHLDAIDTFIKHGRVESEPIDGRIHDAINYLLLLYKMVKRAERWNLIQAPSADIFFTGGQPDGAVIR